MRERLLDWLRCPQCGASLLLRSATLLECSRCARPFEIRDGVPWFAAEETPTAAVFGYTWGRHAGAVAPPAARLFWHLASMQKAAGAPPFDGVILDAGCGDGTDLSILAYEPHCQVVGVELSGGGVQTSLARTRGMARAYVIQGDLLHLPLASGIFDGAYSYGVVHHTPDPARAVREIARTLKPHAPLLFYLYEDFSDRPWYWRAALAAVNAGRLVTTRLPPRVLMGLCRALSPILFVLFTLPARRFRWAARFPHRHNTGPWDLSGDLYDRFAPPIEYRYSKASAEALAAGAGLEVVRCAQDRGWVVWAKKTG